jgi:lipoyl(octanoyl) transferase
MLSERLMTQGLKPVEWRVSSTPVPYSEAVEQMETRVSSIIEGRASELVWLLEHPPLYTAGSSAKDRDLLDARFPVFKTGRGGQYTYHGPGQRVVYLMLDLKRRKPDVRAYVRDLERWLIETLSRLGVRGETRTGRVGIWVPRRDGGEDKIAAIGVRLSKWVSYHGVSLNVAPDLTHYSGIVPCGIGTDTGGITSLAALGAETAMDKIDETLRLSFISTFGPVL